MLLEEKFYVGESGFYFTVETGLDLSVAGAGEIVSVMQRPNMSVVRRVIPTLDVLDAAAGVVLMKVGLGDISMPGMYQAQVFMKDASGRERPSHIFTFEALDAVVKNPSSLFV